MKKQVLLIFFYLLIFSSAVFLNSTFVFASPSYCEKEIKIQGNSSEECERSSNKYFKDEKYSYCADTHWSIRLYETVNQCYVKVMNRELDKRLLSLKEKDKKQFQKEMELQKEFNQQVKKFCDRYYECGGTMYQPIVPSCYAALNGYRIQQVMQLNKNQLEIKEGATPVQWSKSFENFAKGICDLSSGVWREGKIPINCAEKILSEIEKVIDIKSNNICDLK